METPVKQQTSKQLKNQYSNFQALSQPGQLLPHKSHSTQITQTVLLQQRYCQYFIPLLQELNGQDLVKNNNFIQSQSYRNKIQSKIESKMLLSNFTLTNNHCILPKIYPQIQIIKKSKYYNLLEVEITYRHLKKKYQVLNQQQQSHRHQNILLGFGSFSNVYYCESLQPDPIVVKCLKYDQESPEDLKNHIKEFFIYDIMSTLEIGPKVIKNHSFDFILFKNCIEFHMEKCHPIKSETLENDIKQGLLVMHFLCFVHSDIKPSNIMYSKSFNKNILIDFGTAEMIKERRGEKTFTNFKGTYEFCGDQLKKMFLKKQQMLIDMYFNDLQMFQKSLKYVFDKESTQKLNEIKCRNQFAKKQERISQSQLSLMFRFHINENKNKEIYSKQSRSFSGFFRENTDNKTKQKIIKQGLKFINTFEDQNQIDLAYNRILQSFISTYMSNQIQYDDEEEDDCKQATNPDNQAMKLNPLHLLKQKFKKIYTFLQGSSIQFTIMPNNHVNQTSTPIENLKQFSLQETETILFSSTLIQQFLIQQIFALFLKYVSFWKSKFTVSIDKKQQAALIVSKFIKDHNQSKKIEMLDEKYNPELYLFKLQCPNIIWVYRFLLSYCLSGQFTAFNQQFMSLILKDSIILNFKYIKWISTYMIVYMKRLIINEQNKLITKGMIDFYEIGFLTSKNFYCSKYNFQQQRNQSMKKFDQERILGQVIKFIQLNQSIIQNRNNTIIKLILLAKVIRQKEDPINIEQQQDDLANFSQNDLVLIQQNYEQLKKMTKSQISLFRLKIMLAQQHKSNESKQNKENFKLANFYLCELQRFNFRQSPSLVKIDLLDSNYPFKQENLTLIKQLIQFDIRLLNAYKTSFYRKDNDNIEGLRMQLQSFDQKINCKYLSDTFHLIQRCDLANMAREIQQILRISELIVNYEETSYLNYQTILLLHPNLFFQEHLDSFMNSNELIYNRFFQVIQKISSIEDRIILRLKTNKKKLSQALGILMAKFYSQNQQYKQIFFSDSRFNFYLQLFQNLQQIDSKAFTLIILVSYEKFYTLNFLRTRKLMFSFFQPLLIKLQKSIQANQRLLYEQLNLFLIRFQRWPAIAPQQVALWWNNYKLQTTILQPPTLLQRKTIIISLAISNKLKELSQIFIVLLLRIQNHSQYIHWFQWHQIYKSWFIYIATFPPIRAQFFIQFIQNFFQAQKTIKNPLKLLPIYFCVCEFYQILILDQKFFKRTIKQMYVIFYQLLADKLIDRRIKTQLRNSLYISSIRYLKLSNRNNNKIDRNNKKMDKIIKNHGKFSVQDPNSKINVFKFYVKRLKANIMKGFPRNMYKTDQIRLKMHLKQNKIRENCQVNQNQLLQKLQQQNQFYLRPGLSKNVHNSLEENFRRMQFKQKYRIKDMALFQYRDQYKDILIEYVRLQQQGNRESQIYKSEIKKLDDVIMKLKKTQDFALAQDSMQLFRRILQTRGKYLKEKFCQKYHGRFDPDNIPIGLIFAYYDIHISVDLKVTKLQKQ